MPFWQLFYHLVWATKDRRPLLTSAIEPAVFAHLRDKAASLGATVYALNGAEDHVHMVVSIPPKIAVATFVGQVKAVASARINKTAPDGASFFWQEEYAAFSLDRKRLADHVRYVDLQKAHHAARTTIPALERTQEVEPGEGDA